VENLLLGKKFDGLASLYFYFNVITFLISLYTKLLKKRIAITDKLTFRYNGTSLKYWFEIFMAIKRLGKTSIQKIKPVRNSGL